MSVSLSVYLHDCLFVCICIHACLSVRPSVCLSVNQSVCLCMFDRLYTLICLFVCLYVSLSFRLFVLWCSDNLSISVGSHSRITWLDGVDSEQASDTRG